MQGLISSLFWIVFLFGLVCAEIIFCTQLQKTYIKHRETKKEYSLSTNNGKNGHSGRLIKDVEKDLINLRIQSISWLCIAIACAYAIVDCLSTYIIK